MQHPIKLVLIGFVAVLFIGGGVYWWSTQRNQHDALPLTGDAEVAAPEETGPILYVQYPGPEEPDGDGDGIPDTQEESLGLSKEEFDTDGDGLDDALEVNVYKTDPKKVDTDGDSFWDGAEVINGYNPNGEGRL